MGSNEIVPNGEDEANIREKLFGRNEAFAVELFGWTNNIIVKFLGAKAALNIRTLSIENIVDKHVKKDFQWNPEGFFEWVYNKSPVIKLAELNDRSNAIYFKITQPLTVQVLEKKAIQVILKGNVVVTVAKIFVGDETGFCTLTTFNDTIESLYNQVEIGDRLVIVDGSMKKSDFTAEANSFNFDKFLKGELKIRSFEAKRVFRVNEKPLRLPEYLFPSKQVAWLPSDLQRKDNDEFFFPPDLQLLNIFGVVTYVSRISRMEIYRTPEEEAAITSVSRKVHYLCYRWINLIDSIAHKPISIKLYINNFTWKQQKNLVPGIAVVLTNVQQNKFHTFLEFHLESSKYTRMYINKHIMDTFMSLLPSPKDTLTKFRGVLRPAMVIKIFARQDIEWTVGGTLAIPILSIPGLQEFYDDRVAAKENKEEGSSWRTLRPPFSSNPFENFPIARREEQMIFVRGFMYKVFVIHKGGKYRMHCQWTLQDDDLLRKICNGCDKAYTTMIPGNHEDNWFCFRRKFPLTRPDILDDYNQVIQAYNNNLKHRELCQCLLLPSNVESSKKFRELPSAEEDEYFVVYIADPENKKKYACLWNTFQFNVMKQKLDAVHTRVMEQLLAIKETPKDDQNELGRAYMKLNRSLVFIICCNRIEKPKYTVDQLTGDDEIQQDYWDIRLTDFIEYDCDQ